MKLVVAGKDRTSDLGAELARAAAARPAEPFAAVVAKAEPVLALRTARCEAEYLEKHLAALRVRNQAGTWDFDIPCGTGRLGRWSVRLKRFLWRLLRYQHDRMSFQQNAVLHQLTSAIELQRSLQQRELAALEARIAALEQNAPRPAGRADAGGRP